MLIRENKYFSEEIKLSNCLKRNSKRIIPERYLGEGHL